MNEALSRLAAYLKQQDELGMPDFIFSVPLGLAARMPGPALPPGPEMPRTRQASQAPRPLRFGALAAPARAPAVAGAQSPKRSALAALMKSEQNCRKCVHGTTRRAFVFGAGNADAAVMVIGEAPGEEEDKQGLPFVGPAGQLLTQMLAAIRLDRKKDVFITNILKCRPPSNRDPSPQEQAACLPLLRKQIEIIRPAAILVLGRIAAHALLGTTDSVAKLRKLRHTVDGVPAQVTYHPSALLRSPEYKRPAWEDLQTFETMLRELGAHGA
jgi:uracil-DNA glycosylase family 4